MSIRTYPNGLRLSIIKKEKTPLVSVSLYITAGTQSEKNYESGISEFTSRMLLMGIKNYPTYSQLMSFAKSNGVVLSCGNTAEAMYVTAKTTFDNVDKAVDILYHIAFDSSFTEAAGLKVRASLLSDINKIQQNPMYVLERMVNQALFYRTGLANPKFGTNTTISRMTAQDSKEFLNRVLTPKNTILSFVGDVDSEVLYEKVMKTFYARFLEGGEYKKLKFVAPVDDFYGGQRSKNKKLNQSRLFLSFPGVPYKRSDKYALDICVPVLERTLSSRLQNLEFFHQENITNVNFANNGKITLECIVDFDNVNVYLDSVVAAIKDIVEVGISDTEFEFEKNAYIIKYLENTESSEKLALLSAKEIAINKQSYNQASELMKIELLKSVDANDVLSEVFDFTKLYIAYIGNPVEIDSMKYVD